MPSTIISTNDIEAQRDSIPQAHIRTPRFTNPIDDFFGSTTTESRHDSRRSSVAESLPAYCGDTLPEYTPKAEPVTLAMYLFKFGFLFPIFWVLGSIILLSPLRAPESSAGAWLPDKTDAERQMLINEIRVVEVKWAKRCLFALIVFIFLVTAAAVASWTLLKN
ncbi:hypothetical protein BD779DRAFT_1647995 [Infundibulicybe gibba]|nr:hypothetical protein BD779DRAFT_1647995 [Infundibulicybe gibba]